MSENKRRPRWLALLIPIVAVMVAASGLGYAQATSSPGSMDRGHGAMDFGSTVGYYQGSQVKFTYTHGYYCDTSVPAASSTGCEVGAKWNHAPSKQHDPLYITVPLGFNVPMMQMDCPTGLRCVDHPGTLDLTRLATALAPVFKTTPAALEPALRNFKTPGHDHFITDLNNGQPEWWDVYVIGVTSPAVYNAIHLSGSYSYIQQLLKDKNPNVVGPIPTNLFLYFQSI